MGELSSIALETICKGILDSIERNDANELALWLTDAWLLIKMETKQGDNYEG